MVCHVTLRIEGKKKKKKKKKIKKKKKKKNKKKKKKKIKKKKKKKKKKHVDTGRDGRGKHSNESEVCSEKGMDAKYNFLTRDLLDRKERSRSQQTQDMYKRGTLSLSNAHR